MSKTPGDVASEYFALGYSCSESVLWGLQKTWNLPSEVVPRAGSALGGGVGASGHVCGAISGGAVALGLYRGRDDIADEVGKERKKKLYLTMRELIAAFRARFGNSDCRALIELDLTDPVQLKEFQTGGKRELICVPLVKFVADYLSQKVDY